MDVGVVAELHRYPVKSMQGERLDAVDLGPLGIDGDRRVALRDRSTGKIVSAKVPRLGRPLLTCTARTIDDRVEVEVDGRTYHVGDDRAVLESTLGELLGTPVEFVVATKDAAEVYGSVWPELPGMALSGIEIDLPVLAGTFADLEPLHVLTTSSLRRLAAMLPSAGITSQRFRPGILIEDDALSRADGFVENDWDGRHARIGEALIRFGAASPRCIMTTLEQPGLDRAPEVLQVLAAENRRDFGGFGNFACLGVYATVVEPGRVTTGSAVTFLD